MVNFAQGEQIVMVLDKKVTGACGAYPNLSRAMDYIADWSRVDRSTLTVMELPDNRWQVTANGKDYLVLQTRLRT